LQQNFRASVGELRVGICGNCLESLDLKRAALEAHDVDDIEDPAARHRHQHPHAPVTAIPGRSVVPRSYDAKYVARPVVHDREPFTAK
jgi:hypothetical protein